MVSLPPAEGADRLVALAVHPLAHHLAMAAHRLRLLARLALRGLLVVAAQLHLPEDALALHLLLERAQGLVDVVVANQNLHVGRLSCSGHKKKTAQAPTPAPCPAEEWVSYHRPGFL